MVLENATVVGATTEAALTLAYGCRQICPYNSYKTLQVLEDGCGLIHKNRALMESYGNNLRHLGWCVPIEIGTVIGIFFLMPSSFVNRALENKLLIILNYN